MQPRIAPGERLGVWVAEALNDSLKYWQEAQVPLSLWEETQAAEGNMEEETRAAVLTSVTSKSPAGHISQGL